MCEFLIASSVFVSSLSTDYLTDLAVILLDFIHPAFATVLETGFLHLYRLLGTSASFINFVLSSLDAFWKPLFLLVQTSAAFTLLLCFKIKWVISILALILQVIGWSILPNHSTLCFRCTSKNQKPNEHIKLRRLAYTTFELSVVSKHIRV